MGEHEGIIDVWSIEKFDAELRGNLDSHGDVIHGYMLTSRRQWLEREASDRTMPYPENPLCGRIPPGEGAHHAAHGGTHDPCLALYANDR